MRRLLGRGGLVVASVVVVVFSIFPVFVMVGTALALERPDVFPLDDRRVERFNADLAGRTVAVNKAGLGEFLLVAALGAALHYIVIAPLLTAPPINQRFLRRSPTCARALS